MSAFITTRHDNRHSAIYPPSPLLTCEAIRAAEKRLVRFQSGKLPSGRRPLVAERDKHPDALDLPFLQWAGLALSAA